MKAALAQINTVVGDIAGNAGRVRAAAEAAAEKGARLVVFPELTLPGYPAWDLLENRRFIDENLKALAELAAWSKETALVVGYAERNPGRGKPLFNAAALLHRGKVAARQFKSLLPTYDVFDEARYFEPARETAVAPFEGLKLGLSICEDAWNDESFWPRPLYGHDPIKKLTGLGADLLINLSSSPFHRGKGRLRADMLRSHAQRARVPILYCNLVGGNDELIFDGGSLVLDGEGRLAARAKTFEEDLVIVDLKDLRPAELPEEEEIESIGRALLLGLRDYAAKCRFTDVLVGLSGGIDSAVTAALAVEALGPGHVRGVSMPSMYSSAGSVTDAQLLAKDLGIELLTIPIRGLYDAYRDALKDAFRGTKAGLAEQNIQARIRGNLLMALSNKTGALVLSTGNKSELSMGYCTLYGDMSGGLALISDVPKTTVYALGRWLNGRRRAIPEASFTKPPSAELAPNQRDQDDLPPYETLDAILEAYIEGGEDVDEIAARGFDRALVESVLARVDRSEYKRRQAAPGLKLTPKAFGVGRRMPIARGAHR